MNRNPGIAFTFAQRIGLLAILFVVEWLAISVWLDTAGIAGRGGRGLAGHDRQGVLQNLRKNNSPDHE